MSALALEAQPNPAAAATNAARRANFCSDPWVTLAIRSAYGRDPRGKGQEGECAVGIVASYAGGFIFYATASLIAALTVNVLDMPTLGQILDPACRMSVLIVIPEALTPVEKSAALDGLGSSILANRLLWISAAAALLAFTHRRSRLGPLGA